MPAAPQLHLLNYDTPSKLHTNLCQAPVQVELLAQQETHRVDEELPGVLVERLFVKKAARPSIHGASTTPPLQTQHGN